jgi:hypothetical protein
LNRPSMGALSENMFKIIFPCVWEALSSAGSILRNNVYGVIKHCATNTVSV